MKSVNSISQTSTNGPYMQNCKTVYSTSYQLSDIKLPFVYGVIIITVAMCIKIYTAAVLNLLLLMANLLGIAS